MDPQKPVPKRYIGLDVHKHYLVAYGVDGDLTPLLGPRRVAYGELERWIGQTLTPEDALVLEMTTPYEGASSQHLGTVRHPTPPRSIGDRGAPAARGPDHPLPSDE